MNAITISEDCTLYHGDCLEVMKAMPADSVDAVVTDPPYFRVKNSAWDCAWESQEGFIAWLDQILEQYHRLLKPNGSLYLFASSQMAAKVEIAVGGRFNVLNRITWRKHDGTANEGGLWSRAKKDNLRAFFTQKEEIIFAEHCEADNVAKGVAGYQAKCDELRGFVFEPLRAYLAGEFAALGWDAKRINEICGTASMAGKHYTARSQWCLPTAEHYAKLQTAASAPHLRREYEYLRREYEDLRREYEDLRREYEDLRRPFSVTPDVPYTDVWDFPTVQAYPGKHECEKPTDLLGHIIQTSTRPGALVLDSFSGSGSTGVACKRLGRRFIGIEQADHWFKHMQYRLAIPVDHIAKRFSLPKHGYRQSSLFADDSPIPSSAPALAPTIHPC